MRQWTCPNLKMENSKSETQLRGTEQKLKQNENNEDELQKKLRFEKVNIQTIGGMLNPFIPEFLKWILPSLNLVRTIVLNRGLSQKSNRMTV